MTNELLINTLFGIVGVGASLSIIQIIINNKIAKIEGNKPFRFNPKLKNQ